MILRVTKTIAVASMMMAFVGFNAEAKNCNKGKPCGNSCINVNDVCHVDLNNNTSNHPVSGIFHRKHTTQKESVSSGTTTESALPAKTKRAKRHARRAKENITSGTTQSDDMQISKRKHRRVHKHINK